ncbi:hypothetical protein OY671_008409 [Metschnikowia pulcherrima]|nr:hypothetical protein OY671_008409 [Metschnikowia pulcherrima]
MKRHEGTRTRARESRREMTEPERRSWQIVRAGRLGFKFQRQAVLAPYIADFAARSERSVIEIDGETHGSDTAHPRRTADLEARGYRVLRFTNADVMTNPEGVARTVSMASGRDPESPLSPTLSP